MIQLRQYQIDNSDKAAKILMEKRMVYMAMEVRTGKTLTAFATLQKVGAERCLFVTKKKAIPSIQKDAEQIGFDAVVVNYESLHKVTERFKYIVIDEAHCIGSFPKPSLRHKQLKSMITANSYVILLSGTPSPESYSQLYHQFSVHPFNPFHQYTNFYKWAVSFVNKKVKYIGTGQTTNDYSDARWKDIHPIVAPYMIDYTQQQAGFNQTIIENILFVTMRPNTYEIAKAVMKHGIYEGKTDVVLADTGVKQQSKAHQIFSGTVIGENGSYTIDDRKVKAIIDRFQGRKISIFTVYQQESELVRSLIPNCVNTPEAFNSDPTATYVGQIRSSREGVNLSTADCLVYLNIEFSSLSYIQGRDRATYKDRLTPPEVWFIMAKGGIEYEIYQRVQGKQDFTNNHFKKWQKAITNES
jgi:SNF2 family DNA or RNA helicase